MIDTPPPDPRTRVPDPPPDPGSRYEHACLGCGRPLHPDQAACLSCGTMVQQDDVGVGIRRAALGSVTALLVLGGAVGAAVAGLPHGKSVPKPETAKVFGPKGPKAPAIAGTNGGPGTGPTAPLPGGDTASKPPPIASEKPHRTKGPSVRPSVGSSGAGSSSGTSGGTSSNKNTKKKDKGKKPKPKPLRLFTSGLTPADAREFTGSAKPTPAASRTADNDAKTAWKATSAGIGIIVEPASPPYKGLGVVSSTPGYGVKVYYTNKSTPPSDVNDWSPVESVSSAGRHQRFKFSKNAQNADHYLVWIIGLPSGGKAAINEIQLFN